MADRGTDGTVRMRFETVHDREAVHCFSVANDDVEDQMLQLTMWYDATFADGAVRRTVAHMRLRYTYRYELELMLEASGFLVSRVYGSYNLDPYTAGSENLLVVAASA